MNLLKSLAAVSSMTMFSRVLGFARDAIVARVFGAGMATDAFFVAFKLPNLLRRIFAEGAFSQAFVPILAQNIKANRAKMPPASLWPTFRITDAGAGDRDRPGDAGSALGDDGDGAGFADTADKFTLTTQLLRITFPCIFC
ncbi:lipid II flippase MurJ [Enterobacter hormaechei]